MRIVFHLIISVTMKCNCYENASGLEHWYRYRQGWIKFSYSFKIHTAKNLAQDFHNNDHKNAKNGNLYGCGVFNSLKVLIKFYVLHKIWNRIRIKYIIMISISLIVQYDVGQPYVFWRYMQSLHTAVVIGIPLQFVVVPFLQQNKPIYSVS